MPRRTAQDEMAAIARRRLDLLSAELAGVREAAAGRPAADDVLPAGLATVVGAGAEPPRPTVAPPGRHARRPLGTASRVGGWMHDRLPPTLQGRARLTTAHLTVVALMVAVALAVTSWWVLRADGSVTVVRARAGAGDDVSNGLTHGGPALVTPAAQQVEPAASEPAVVVVDVAGKVRRPGITSLPIGSRVVDAIEAAGGARRGVDLTALNLARVLVDGEQIVVGVPPPGGVAAPAASAVVGDASDAGGGSGPLVNINTATQSELEELPGVGPVTAGAILQWRTDNGPFTSVDELMEVSGIGEATLAEIAPFVTL